MSLFEGLPRAVFRAAIYPAIPLAFTASYWLAVRRRDVRSRLAWLQRVANAHRHWLNLQIHVFGEIPRDGLVVANHVSYLDIVALSAVAGCGFVAKKEVAHWPIFGGYARRGATIFVDRERRGEVGEIAIQLKSLLAAGAPVVLFPEGTSSDGTKVLPFRSSLLEPAIQLRCPVTPCGIRYILPDGSLPDEVAYWGDMTLAPHLWNLMRKPSVTVELHFGTPRSSFTDRKELTRSSQRDVEALLGIDRAAPSATQVGDVVDGRSSTAQRPSQKP